MQQRRRLNAVSQRPALALILSIAMVAAVAVGLNEGGILRTQEAGVAPVSASEGTVPLSSGENVVVEDAAIATQGGAEGGTSRTVKEFTRDESFSMFALTWEGQRDIATYVRAASAEGNWGPWYAAEPMEEVSPTGMSGTDLIYVEPTNKIQVSISGVDILGAEAGEAPAETAPLEEAPVEEAPVEEAPAEQAPVTEAATEAVSGEAPAAPAEQAPAAEAPAAEAPVGAGTAPLPSNYGDIQPVAEVTSADDIQAVFIDGNAEEGGIALASESDTQGMPNVISRAGWGANEGLRCSNPTIDNQVSAITIHHTAGSNNYSEADSAAQMRGYYRYHASTLGWCDIGYQALVDKYGNIYEGRAGGMNRGVRGAHAGGFNENTWAISMMGDYSNVTPTQATIQSVGELAGWRATVSDADFDPLGSDVHYSEGTSYAKYPYGASVTLPNIFAHRDVGNTSCPGNAGYAQMGNIRNIAKSTYDSIKANDTGDETDPTTPTAPTQPGEDGQQPTLPAPEQPAPAETDNSQVSSQLSSINGLDLAGLLGGDQEALIAAAGTIAVIALSIAMSQGDVNGLSNVGDVEVVNGLQLSHIPPLLEGAAPLSGDSEFSQLLRTILDIFGPVLGESRSGVQYAGERNGNSNVNYALFDRGIMLSSDQTGAHALWGAIGDAWAGQGYDLGPLGLPTSNEYAAGNLTRVDFQNGYITYDPAADAVDIQLN